MPAHFPMQATHTIHSSASPNCQIGHVEAFRRVVRIMAAEREQIIQCDAEFLHGVTAQVLFDERLSEPVKAGGHRRVCSKDVPRSSSSQCNFKRLTCILHKISCAFQHSEGGVPFVQVTYFRLKAERTQQPPSADPKHHFLFQAQFRSAPIEFACNASMNGGVCSVVAVQQVELHSADLYLPCTQPNRVSWYHDLQPQPLAVRLSQRRDRQLSRVVIRVEGLLRSVPVEHLSKIPLLIQQPNTDNRHTQIAGGLQLIAGHIPKPSRIDRERFAQHELHAEVRNAGQWGLRIIFLKPPLCFLRLLLGLHEGINLLAEGRIGQHCLDLLS